MRLCAFRTTANQRTRNFLSRLFYNSMSYVPIEENISGVKPVSKTPLVFGIITLIFSVVFLGLIFGGPPLMDYLIFQGLVQQRVITSANSTGYLQWQSNNASTGVDPE